MTADNKRIWKESEIKAQAQAAPAGLIEEFNQAQKEGRVVYGV
jgi:hypothetical protein